MQRHLGGLPRDNEIVVYCRGPYCVHADEAVRELSGHGYRRTTALGAETASNPPRSQHATRTRS